VPTRAPFERLALVAAATLLAGCVMPHTPPAEFFRLSEQSGLHRAAQTRIFETANQRELLSASAATLQDLGFQIDESAPEVGFLRAAKERAAREYGQEILRGVLFVVGVAGRSLILIPVDLQQQIVASLAIRPIAADGSRQEVRIAFYRIVWKGDGQQSSQNSSQYIPPGLQRMEMIRGAELYQQFFARLSKAVFLEAQRI